VHRDLKPQNILVGAGGQLKVLDFGVAKLLDEADSEQSLTASGRVTPGYAAPEQISGGAITVGTDVFALGVLLAELLLGRRPATHELGIRALRSAGLTPAELAHVVGQACAPEPARRYGSVAELREDVERLLAGEPVRAHPPSVAYRAFKFVARHRVAVAAAVLVVLSLATATAIVADQASVARDQARRAARAAATSKAVQEFMVGLFASAAEQLPSDRAPSTRELLDLGVKRARVDFASEPDVAIDLLRRFAQSYSALHLLDRAAPVAEEYFDAARARYGEESVETALARLERGRAAFLGNDFARAESELTTACGLLGRLAPGTLELAECQGQLGSLWITTGRIDKGIAESEHAEQILSRACTASDAAGACRDALATGYAVALAESFRGRLEASRDRLAPLVERGRATLTDRRLLAQMLNSLGAMHQRLGANELAEKHVREALALAEAVGESAADVVLECKSELAAALASRGALRGAAEELAQVVAELDRLHPQGHRLSADQRTNRAIYLIDVGELPEADRALASALAWYRGESPVHEVGVARVLELTARLRALQGRSDEARALAEESLRLRRAAPNARDLGSVLLTLARIHLDRHDPRAALAAAREGYGASLEGLGEGHPLQALRSARLGDALLAGGDRVAARAAIDRAERWGAERLNPAHPNRCRIALSHARLLLAEGDAASALRLARQVCSSFAATLGPSSEAMHDLRLVEQAAASTKRSAAAASQRE
jgi:serine/threonine-protein kinase